MSRLMMQNIAFYKLNLLTWLEYYREEEKMFNNSSVSDSY